MQLLSADPERNARRFLFYSHDGLGLGHTRRNLAIATALTELCPSASVLIASGTEEVHRLGLPPGVEVLKLPGLRKIANEEYESRRLHVTTQDIRELRASILEAAVKSFHPDVTLVDKHPFGARGEFRAGLAAMKDYGGRCVLGLRDILDAPATVRREWAEHQLPERIAGFHDRVFVYGEQSVFNPIAEYDFPEALAERTRFCGYVVSRDPDNELEPLPKEFAAPRRTRPLVLATTGGGEDGFALLEHFIDAMKSSPWQGVAVTGPMMPERESFLLRARAAKARVILHHFIPRLPALFPSVDALVCMGGYNTLAEVASYGVPTVCVPRVTPRSEQWIRARAFERLGILQALHPDAMNAATLREAVAAALQTPRRTVHARAAASLRFDGARRAAEELLELADAECKTSEPCTVVAG